MNVQSLRTRRSFFRSGVWAICGVWILSTLPPASAADAVQITKLDGKLRVEIGGQLFTEYVYEGQAKPVLYPIVGPHGICMTRHYPLKKGVKGEAEDHRHHTSLWFTHGDVNGVSFWHEGSGAGKTIQSKLLEVSSGERGVIRTENRWVDADGKVRCTDTRVVTFHTLPAGRAIDYQITIHASEGDVKFGDTKEGTMGIRTHPNLRLKNDPGRGVTGANGHALNSAGDRDRELWGKRAEWVDYWGVVDGKTVGVAILDHPKNPRHPTWWHARDYGLIAANPFGVHDFERKPKGTGDFKIKGGESVTFRYRFIFHEGDAEKAEVAKRFEEFAAN